MRRHAILVAATLALSAPATAQSTDPADLAFWQSILNSSNPAEYQAYLQAFPNGRFAPLARLRAGGAGLPAPAQPAGAPGTGTLPMPAGPLPAAPTSAAGGGEPIPQDDAPVFGGGRFVFKAVREVVSIGAKPQVRYSNLPPEVKLSIIVMRAGGDVPNWRYDSPDIVQREDIHYFDHDPDPSGPNRYKDTGTQTFEPLPMGDYWIRFYTNMLTGGDTLIGSVAIRVQ